MRPEQELKAYCKVFFTSGESKKVSFQLSVSDLAFYGESISDWKVEEGKYELRAGFSSCDIIDSLVISVD